MFITSIFFILFIALLFKILIKKEKKVEINIYSYIKNSFLIVNVLKKVINITKILKKFAKIEAWKFQNDIVFD